MSKKASPTPDSAAAAKEAADPVSRFEGSLKELEGIVARMEHGDLPLDESLRLFERGMALTRECRQSLETAELRVRDLLAEESGKPSPEPESES
jgi:exodeoxyribonuclease VII small subunit